MFHLFQECIFNLLGVLFYYLLVQFFVLLQFYFFGNNIS